MTEDDLALAAHLADLAGATIRPLFRRPFALEAKADRSPVTEADRAAEAAMRAALAEHRPDDGVIGEEYGVDRPEAARVWVLDPIDGTRSFIAGRPIFGTLIALVEDERPVLGVIDQPIAGERWIGADGHGTTLNGAPAHVRGCMQLADAHVATTGPSYFSAQGWAAYEHVRAQARDCLWGGDCYNYGLLAAGHLDLVIEEGLKLHDFAALAPIVEAAGGRMTDWDGNALRQSSDGRVIAAGDAHLIDQAVVALTG
jgi:inositol-phosphate phosphatase / L-galactose 1-phosphate phosphatase / histidinol-phosphatase